MKCNRAECLIEFVPKDYRQKFCSHSCAAIVSNGNRTVIKFCLQCKEKISAKGTKAKFCSRTCSARYKSESFIDRWLNGEETGSDVNGALRKSCRAYLLEKAGHACTECGWSKPNPVTGLPILTVEHKDGDWSNNFIDNLVVICYNCHTLTPTFGSLNRGSKSGSRPNASSRRR